MKISIVISVYNEEAVLVPFHNELKKILNIHKDYSFDIIFVNDGSIDGSGEILKTLSDSSSNIKTINFSKNFGHEAAMIAGIDEASGDFIICMDSDLQHPPKLIKDIILKIEDGYHIINMVRISNKKEKLWKRMSSKVFYKFINLVCHVKFEPNASDFFVISNKVANIFRENYRERIRFLRGYIQMVGFKKATIEFHADERLAGKSKYTALSLLKFAIGVTFTFSNLPLRLGLYTSFMSFFIGMNIIIYTVVMKLNGNYSPEGYTTIVVLLSFFFSILFFIIGIIGEYLRMIFEESKERPIYIIDTLYKGDGNE